MKLACSLITVFSFSLILTAQTVIDHPIRLVNSTVEANEFMIFHTDGLGNSNPDTKTTIGEYNPAGASLSQRIVEASSVTNPTSASTNGSKFISAIALDYNGDGYDEPVCVVEQANTIRGLVYPSVSKGNLSSVVDPASPIDWLPTPGNGMEIVKMAKGDFEGDGIEELVLLTRTSVNSSLLIQIRNIMPISSTQGSVLQKEVYIHPFEPLSNSDYEAFDIAVGDYDGDGALDIAVVAFEQGASSRQCYLQLYQVDIPNATSLTWQVTPRGKLVISPTGGSTGWENVAISSFSPFVGPDRLCVALVYQDPTDNSNMKREVYSIITDPISEVYSLDSPTALASPYTNDIQNGGNRIAMSMAAGDLANIEEDMVAVAWDGEVRVFSPYASQVYLRASSSGGTVQDQFYRLTLGNSYLSIGDVDYDKSQDIMIVTTDDDGNSNHSLRVSLLGLDQSLDAITVKGSKEIQSQAWAGASSDYHFAATLGEFRGGRAVLKEPTNISKTLFTPLIINNAPPHHFDILNETEADILEAYPTWPTTPSSGTISSLYHEVSSTSQTLETTLTSDWGVSGTLSAGFSKLGNGIKTSVTAKYGEEFSATQMNTDTVTIKTVSTALSDDQVYGVVQEYEIYEYPVDSSGHTIGYVLAMVRQGTPIIQWMDSKSPSALDYVPDHEPGNLLSYPSLSNFDSYAGVADPILTGTGKEIGNGGGLDFEMAFSDFSSSSASTTKTFGAEVNVAASASFKYFDVGLEVNGTYNRSEMTTHTSTAFSEIKFTSDLNRALDPAFSDAYYTVTPRTYWADNGALTLGYAVDPTLDNQGVNTFWSDNYTAHPDLSLILPWRLDVEKGFTLGSTADKPRLSKSISLSRTSFATGDTIIIHAFIQNYSFQDHTGPVEFQFYAGNPDDGGTLLSDINGQSTMTVTDVFMARERTPIQFYWKVPAGITPGSRIYVVIDPNNAITEIHEDNNVGFLAGNGGVINAIEEEDLARPIQTKLYPNPSTDKAELEIILPNRGMLQVELLDLQGRLIETVYHHDLHAGNFILPIDVSDLQAGIYLLKVGLDKQQTVLRLVKQP